MYLGQSLSQNITSTVLIVASLVFIGWVVKLMLEKDTD